MAEFRKKYISHVYLEAKRREFLALRQRQLLKFDKYRRFEDRLNDSIRLIVTSHHFTDFSLLVASTLDVERIRDEEQSRRDRQSKRGSGSGQFSLVANGSEKPKESQGQTQVQGKRQRSWFAPTRGG